MTNQSIIINNIVNQAFIQSQIQRSKDFATPLCAVKFELKFHPKEGAKFQEIFSFIYSYLNFTPIIYESGNSYLLFIHESKIHTVVSTLKNMFTSIKIKYGVFINNVGVTNFDDEDTAASLMERVHRFLLKSKLSQNNHIYYGTRYFDYSHNGDFENISHIFMQSPTLNVYGFYKEIPLSNQVEVVESKMGYAKVRSPKEYIPFMKRQEYVYLEHKMIPDILRADVMHIDYQNSFVELSNFKFLDNSPVHRKNIRVTPHRPVQASLEYEDEIYIQGLIADISKNSILFTTQLNKIEEIQVKGLHTKTFTLEFHIEDMENQIRNIQVKAMIYKVFGNQIVLNIYPSLEAQNIIMEYITMCQNLLLLEIKGAA
ncbi:MAG: hypothetical protein DSZ05_03795 [Sulfurospirillum sp.]|nr:MAG: hypothetical protein DSZ05_03795 [Sulfurospirillum sp.]